MASKASAHYDEKAAAIKPAIVKISGPPQVSIIEKNSPVGSQKKVRM